MSTSVDKTVIYGSGTIVGLVHNSQPKQSPKSFAIPEIVITGSSTQSLNKNEDEANEGTSLLEQQTSPPPPPHHPSERPSLKDLSEEPTPAAVHSNDEEFEQFILNRTISENNMLDSSIYSELQFPPSLCGSASNYSGNIVTHHIYNSNDGGSRSNLGSISPTQQIASTATSQTSANHLTRMSQRPRSHPALQQEPSSNANVTDVLNSSLCSHESRQMRRVRRKMRIKSKCNSGSNESNRLGVVNCPPRYTAIFMDSHNPANASMMGQLANAAASSPFLNSQTNEGPHSQFISSPEYPYYQQRPLLAMGQSPSSRTGDGVGLPTIAPSVAMASTSSGFNICKWFTRPSLPFIIGIFALGGVACTLGGIVLGSTGLIEHSTQYLSAALLMIGIGVSLLVIAGAIWRISLPDDLENCHCYRHMETCMNCNNPYCYNRMFGNGYFYPEFQYRTPPPSYLTSLNEYAAMSYLFHPSTGTQRAPDAMRINTPPPMYRSTNSLSIYQALPQTTPGIIQASTSSSVNPMLSRPALFKQSSTTLATVAENMPSEPEDPQSQPLTKDINYLELD